MWTGGLFYDRNNSLPASIIVKGHGNPMLRVNISPGIFDIAGAKVGATALMDNDARLSLGISLQYIPVGLGFTL